LLQQRQNPKIYRSQQLTLFARNYRRSKYPISNIRSNYPTFIEKYTVKHNIDDNTNIFYARYVDDTHILHKINTVD
jgi:hypothetical protein